MVYEQAYLDQDHGSQAMNSLSELWKKQILCDATVCAGPYKISVSCFYFCIFKLSPFL